MTYCFRTSSQKLPSSTAYLGNIRYLSRGCNPEVAETERTRHIVVVNISTVTMIKASTGKLLVRGGFEFSALASGRYTPICRSLTCINSVAKRCLTSTTPEKKTTVAPHFKDAHAPSLSKAAMDLHEYKPSDTPYTLPHPVWNDEEVKEVKVDHFRPKGAVDWAAYGCVQAMRATFDLISLYKIGVMDESKWLTRIILLETVAGVPGMVGAMTRHFHSLRRMARDHGWIHTLLEEAENERMHLMTALMLKNPGKVFRASVLVLQGVFVNMFFLAYLISPKFCHRFVGYLEEEAVKTYTHCLECIDNGKLPMWKNLAAPEIAKKYWRLEPDAMMRDVILAIRADEAHHRFVNHTLGSLDKDKPNPFAPGK